MEVCVIVIHPAHHYAILQLHFRVWFRGRSLGAPPDLIDGIGRYHRDLVPLLSPTTLFEPLVHVIRPHTHHREFSIHFSFFLIQPATLDSNSPLATPCNIRCVFSS